MFIIIYNLNHINSKYNYNYVFQSFPMRLDTNSNATMITNQYKY